MYVRFFFFIIIVFLFAGAFECRRAIFTLCRGRRSYARERPPFFFTFFFLRFLSFVQTEDQRRESFKRKMKKHLEVVVEEALELIDAAADQMGKR